MLAKGLPPEIRAVARNLLSDHRIPRERASTISDLEDENLEELLRDYQDKYVRPWRNDNLPPVYALPVNGTNAIVEQPESLCTVLNLTRWQRYYEAANKDFGMKEFRSFEFDKAGSPDQLNARLLEKLSDEGRRAEFMDAIFKARSRYLREVEERWHPVWAANWDGVEHFLDIDRPSRWQQAVGVESKAPSWLAIVKYSLKDRKVLGSGKSSGNDRGIDGREASLFRPTQLEAGWYARHFPSPPQTELDQGGICMFLHPQGEADAADSAGPLTTPRGPL